MGIFSKLFNLNVKSDAEENEIVENNAPKINCSNFLLVVEDVFTITGIGTVVTGLVSEGSIRVGEKVKINENLTSTVIGIESFRKKHEYATVGQKIGLVLSNISKEEVKRGDKITK